jgi:Holliday junction resolvasome RuvABC ATP-dependent DNA helicase subunit
MMDSVPRYIDIVGQVDCVARLRAFVDFYRKNGSTPEHILIVGDEGMGKNTISTAVAHELGVLAQEVDAATLQVKGDLTAILTNLRENQVLMIRNISRMRRNLEDLLVQVLRSSKLDIIIGQGQSAVTHTMNIAPFTLICAAPKKSDCSPDLVSCFSLVLSLQPYSIESLEQIAERIAAQSNLEIESEARKLIALNSGSSPHQLELLVQRVARAAKKQRITAEDALQAFAAFGMNVHMNAETASAGNLELMSGIDLERLVTALLSRMDFRAEMTKATGDGGIDIVAFLDKPITGGKYLFQCKRYAPDNLVGAATVREFYGAVTAENAVKGILITTSDFTAQAREFADRVGVELIGLAGLQQLLVQFDMGTSPDRQRFPNPFS